MSGARRAVYCAGRMFDLGGGSRLALAAAWVCGQCVLIATGSLRHGAPFAFRMFPESSTVAISLSREVAKQSDPAADTVVPIEGGRWLARDRGGILREHAWSDRVRDPTLSRLEVTQNAAYGHQTQLRRLGAALDDVAASLTADAETRWLIADVVVTHNGRPAKTVHLASGARW